MPIYVISDLHVSFAQPKPMDVFGSAWQNHAERIRENWLRRVTDEDVVLLGGDTSWAMRCDDALIDFEWISALPGQKVLIKGNHDYWWSHKSRISAQFPKLFFLNNNFFYTETAAICGTRGWNIPGTGMTEADLKIYRRELLRLESSLEQAVSAGCRDIVAMIHYPPTPDGQSTGFTDILERYPVRSVLFGHIHDEERFRHQFQGYKSGIEYRLTSSDYQCFDLAAVEPASDFDHPWSLLRLRGDLIDRLSGGALDKSEFIEENYRLYADCRRREVSTRVLSVEDGILKYNYFNALAKKRLLEADRFEYCDPKRYGKMRREAYELYERKDAVTLSFVRLLRERYPSVCADAYYIESGSEYLAGKLFEIHWPNLDRAVMHSMSPEIAALFPEMGRALRPSVIPDYVNRKIGFL